MFQFKKVLLSLAIALMVASSTWANISLAESCDTDFSPYVKIGSKHYLIEDTLTIDWFGAAQHCRLNGGFLADIESDAELEALNAALKQISDLKYFWISGNDLSIEGEFRSTGTGQILSYYNWLPNQPDNNKNNENCIMLRTTNEHSYLMNDLNCDAQNMNE